MFFGDDPEAFASREGTTASLRGARDKIAEQFCAEATKQSRIFSAGTTGLLRFARNDGREH
jgi:hypothetical protein